MFTTIEQVKELTGRDVTRETISMAQSIIESYVGRVEVDIDTATDRELLGKATAYQAYYIDEDPSLVFEQVATTQVMQYGNMISFSPDGVSPWIAPLAVIACRKLSWKRMRSVRTGSIFTNTKDTYTWSSE